MSTENPVFQVLVTSGNQAPLAKDLTMSSLKIGQVGIFNAHGNKSVDGSVPANAKDIYLVVGTGLAAVGQPLEDIVKSSGQFIQARNAKDLTFKAYMPPLPKIVEIGGFNAKCNSDYSIKVELRSQQSYMAFGFNGLNKNFDYHTPCCPDDSFFNECESCSQQGSNADLAVNLVNSINADPDAVLVASLFANKISATIGAAAAAAGTLTISLGAENFSVVVASGDTQTVVAQKIAATINATTTSGYTAGYVAGVLNVYPKTSISGNAATIALTSAGGTSVTMTGITSANTNVTDGVAFQAANPGAGLAIRITTVNGTNPPFNGNIPIKYYDAKETDIIVSLTDGFWCSGSTTIIQNVQYEDGDGYNLAYDEYVAGGWNGKPGPYRISAVTGLQNGGFNTNVNPNANYNVVSIEYDQFSTGGWEEYSNSLRSIIAIPCADTTTLTGLATMLDAIFTQFGAMSNDVAGINCTNVATTNINNYALDGIEVLA